MAHAKHEDVRRRYRFRCGYCGISETDAGGELTVDHYHPEAAGGTEADENLVYACFRCNLNKGAVLPEIPDAPGEYRVLHPLRHDVPAHVQDDEETGLLQPLTETGRRHIALLRLNRPALVRHRWRKRLEELAQAEFMAQQRHIEEQRRVIAAQEEYAAVLESLLRRTAATEEHDP